MTQAPIAPVVLVILDGWGYRPEKSGNAIEAANTPIMDSLWAAYPHTLIGTWPCRWFARWSNGQL
jgi:2,3-bisphosphoglycerate-independent phosphoglycerate mutase